MGLLWRAMLSAIDSTKAVLPIAGRAAIMMRSEFRQPDVYLSSSRKPLLSPLRPDSRF